MKLKLLTAGILAGLGGPALAHVHYHDLTLDGPAVTQAMTGHGWAFATDVPGVNPVDIDGTNRWLGDSHLMTFYKFNLASATRVTITLTSNSADLDPAFSLYRGLMPAEAHDAAAGDPAVWNPTSGPHPTDPVSEWDFAKNGQRDGQFNPFGDWSMANELSPSSWAKINYVAHKNDNTVQGSGQSETLTMNLQPGNYTVVAAGATMDDLLPVANQATLTLKTAAAPATPTPAPATPTPAPATPTPAPATPAPSTSPAPSASPNPSASPSPSASPTPSASPAPSASPEPSASPSPTPGPTDSPAVEVTGGSDDLKVGDSVHFLVKATDPQGQPVDVSAMLDNEAVAEVPGDLSDALNEAVAGTDTEAALAASVEAVSTTPAEPTTDDGSQCKIGHAVPVLVTDTLGNAMFKWIPTKDDAGSHILVIKATDPDGNTTEESITIDVKALPQENRAPHFDWTGGWYGAEPGKQLKIKLQAMDPDGDDVRFFIQKGPRGAEIKNASFNKKTGKWEATWMYKPERDEAGNTYKVYFTATDDKPGEAKQTTRWTYVHVNEPKYKHKHDDDNRGKGSRKGQDKD